jgi:hypothetical protein
MGNRGRLTQLVVATLLAPLFVTPVAAQQPGIAASSAITAVGSMFLTLLFGIALLAYTPSSATRRTELIREKPGKTFVFGLVVGVVLGVLAGVLFLVRFGLILIVPLALGFLVAGVYGYLAAGYAVAGSWSLGLAVAVGIAGFVGAVPIVGPMLGFVIGNMGIGTVYLDYRGESQV